MCNLIPAGMKAPALFPSPALMYHNCTTTVVRAATGWIVGGGGRWKDSKILFEWGSKKFGVIIYYTCSQELKRIVF